MPEAAESHLNWKHCIKNPEHKNFLSVVDFRNHHLSKVLDDRSREVLSISTDLTVRLRVNYTSRRRPHDDEFSQSRGSFNLRTGTGFIRDVFPPKSNMRCPCVECGSEITKKLWMFSVRTAHHVVFNTKEAKETKIDLFFDDERCDRDGRMKYLVGVEVMGCDPYKDMCHMLCVTCDEDVAKRIESAYRYFNVHSRPALDLSGLDFPPSCNHDSHFALIVSHPHGQPKKVTVGEWREVEEDLRVNYTVPTCPGSSGAPVFKFNYFNEKLYGLDLFIFPLVHIGSSSEISADDKEQLNYGF